MPTNLGGGIVLGEAQTPQQIAAAPGYNNGLTPTPVASNQPATPPQTYNSGNGALMAPNGSPVAAPAGAQQSANGMWYSNGQAYQTGPVQGGSPNYATGGATMNANISTPANANARIAPPAVISSSTATTDLANKQAQTNQLNQDAQTQASTKAANAQAAATAIATPTNTPETSTGGTSTDNTGGLDKQISDLIGSLGSDQAAITANENATLSPMQEQQQQAMVQLDQQASYSLNLLNQISSGTYPLSPAEQSVLSSTVAQYQQVIAAQQNANTAYSGQMTELMASLGISTSAPTQSMGMIQATIDSGNSKIATLDGQMASAVANLTLGFQKQDYAMVQSSWDATSKYLDDRITTLQTMQKNIIDYAAQQKTELQAQVSTNLTAVMDSANFDYKAKSDAINQAFQNKQLDETTRHNLEQELNAKYTATTARMALGDMGGSGNSLPQVDVGASGKPDSVSQAAFLAQFPANVASLIKGVANYTINPSSISTSKKQSMGGFTQSQILSLASQYNPNFSQASYATRTAMQKNITSGTYSQSINAANTLVQHLAKLQADFSSLGNTGSIGIILNPVKNLEMGLLGSGKGTAVQTDIQAVASEAARIYKGVGAPSEQEIKDWQSTVNPNMSPDQMKSAIQSITDLMAGKLSTLSDNYTSVMGQPGDFQILTDRNAQTLQQMGIDPTTVDPTYGNSPTVKLSNFYGSDPKNSALIDQLIQADPTLKADPAKMIDTLNANGISL